MCLPLSLSRPVLTLLQAVTSHPGGLGSGWRMVILALRLGAADGSPAVMVQTQEALQVGQARSNRGVAASSQLTLWLALQLPRLWLSRRPAMSAAVKQASALGHA